MDALRKSKPQFQIGTRWPDGQTTMKSVTGDGFMFPDAHYGTAWLLNGDEYILGFSIDDGSERCGGRRTILRIV